MTEFAGDIWSERQRYLEITQGTLAAIQREQRQVPLTTVGDEGGEVVPHSFTAWVDLRADPNQPSYIFCAGSRQHAEDILRPPRVNRSAYISGSLAVIHQVSRPVVGIQFLGQAELVEDAAERTHVFEEWACSGLFQPDEIANYLRTKPDVPSHEVFKLNLLMVKHTDTTRPIRSVTLGDRPCPQRLVRESRYGYHAHNPHLHLPLRSSLSV